MKPSNDFIIEAFKKRLPIIDPDNFVIMSDKGELHAQDILKEMNEGTEFGLNFIESIRKMVFSIPKNTEGVSIIVGTRKLNTQEIVKEMEEGTEFGLNFLESALDIVFKILQKSFQKKS